MRTAVATVLLLIVSGCAGAVVVPPKTPPSAALPNPDSTTITLQWHPAYDGESKAAIETGLKWVFLNLGAQLPEGSFSKSCTWLDGQRIEINFSGLGFSPGAVRALASLNSYLLRSEEYEIHGSFDIGKYVMLTMNSSYHYYAISEVPRDLSAYRLEHPFDHKLAAILESTVAFNGRLIELPDSPSLNAAEANFVVHTGTGDISNHSFVTSEYETMQLMPNGQFRFAIYDKEGSLIPVSNSALGIAGKPSKCMWCHEINVQLTHAAVTNAPSEYYAFSEFNDLIGKWRSSTRNYRATLRQDVDFTHTQDHTFGELLYITFMEPSAARLASEWDISVADVRKRLSAFSTHRNREHDSLGELYNRVKIDSLSPFPTVKFPGSDREYSSFEPQYIK